MIGAIIKEIREEHNLNQTDFAQKIGYNQSAVARWENGKRTPTVEAIISIAKTFDIDANYILGLKEL